MKATLDWQTGFAALLPDIPYAGIVLTMRGDFWRIFQLNRHLLDDLPGLAAGVLQDFARVKYGAEVMITVVRHTFGSRLEFNCHLHILVSTVGINKRGTKIVRNVKFYKDSVMRLWRHAVIDYLRFALKNHQIKGASRKQNSKNYSIRTMTCGGRPKSIIFGQNAGLSTISRDIFCALRLLNTS